MSGDFRLKDADVYRRYYGQVHPAPELLQAFVYGLPELNREQIKKAQNVASPGCFATSIALGLLPLARAGLLSRQAGAMVVHTTGITGSSGSGIAPAAGTHHPTRAGNLRTYKPLEHQHTPEILETLASAGAPAVELRFVPVSAPLVRGIFVSSFLELSAAITPGQIESAFASAFDGERFVRRLPSGPGVKNPRLPEVVAVAGSNHAEVAYALGPVVEERRTVTVFSALDNLIKGGAGQAIQNMNLMLGLAEQLSLEDVGPWP
jgi:N-acetyl-gamma-glutamyl-phosphate/LysW-gamma-L-alpha-aminoadipyl-6-phosphate reductase